MVGKDVITRIYIYSPKLSIKWRKNMFEVQAKENELDLIELKAKQI
jgi:hypothetical protein